MQLIFDCPPSSHFSLVTPGIIGVGFLDRASSEYVGSKDAFANMSAEEDGLRKLDHSQFNQYIPDIDGNSLESHFALPLTCRHLISSSSSRTEFNPPPDSVSDVLHQVLELLEVSADDFNFNQPLTLYGLDSISAAKLSSILRPYTAFTQMQLLGGVTWTDVQNGLTFTSGTHNLELDTAVQTHDILLSILGVDPNDFSADIPLSSYGLDSLGASILATALRP
ncbi:hypothetical protein C8J57DRAFT_1539730 [Mycena rebaudengoi]|nr:hypothetical protein C8J57DRAFT_1539730 [Mycena rebaudengoi]